MSSKSSTNVGYHYLSKFMYALNLGGLSCALIQC